MLALAQRAGAPHLETLGVADGADLVLLEGSDLLPEAIPHDDAVRLEREYPRRLAMGDATYEVVYDSASRIATLRQTSGSRKTPPPSEYLPRLPGWQLDWELKNRVRIVRPRR